MLKRQSNFVKINQAVHSDGREHVFGDNTKLDYSGVNTIEDSVNSKTYHYLAFIRLKDLCNWFEVSPLLKGANIRLTLNVNTQCHFKVFKDLAGNLSFNANSYNGSPTNPLMVAASHVSIPCGVGGSLSDVSSQVLEVGAGSQNLPCNQTYDFTMSLVKNTFLNIGTPEHIQKSCRLYVSTYQFQPQYELQYLALKTKEITYTDLISFPKLNVSDNFNFLVSSGIARAKRLIVIPIIASSSNGTTTEKFSPLISPFSTEPSTCSPYIISNYSVTLGGLNLYQDTISTKYQTFLSEMNGQYGVEANLTTGICSSRISLNDYNQNYGYLVSDLSRRSVEDDSVPISIQISGKIESLLNLDFFIFIEISKTVTIDLASGAMIS
jgi:hypothetical protein